MLAVLGVPQMLSSYFDLRARRQEEERRRQDDERRRQDVETAERRHQEFMTLLVAAVNNRGNQGSGQDEFIHTLQQTIEDLRAENAQLRRQNGNGSPSS
jgi:hypothetical protein